MAAEPVRPEPVLRNRSGHNSERPAYPKTKQNKKQNSGAKPRNSVNPAKLGMVSSYPSPTSLSPLPKAFPCCLQCTVFSLAGEILHLLFPVPVLHPQPWPHPLSPCSVNSSSPDLPAPVSSLGHVLSLNSALFFCISFPVCSLYIYLCLYSDMSILLTRL